MTNPIRPDPSRAATPHHLPLSEEQVAGNGGVGRLFFLPGSDGRASRISERFLDRQEIPSDRRLNAYLGRLEADGRSVDVGAVSTGMGCPSLNIVVTELILLGARRLIRVGTCGSLRPDVVRVGDLVIATGGVRDEGTSDRYVERDYPAIADPDIVAALERGATLSGHAARTFKGLVHTKDSLYALEFGHGPHWVDNEAYVERLRHMRVLATDMEASHLFVLSDAHSVEIANLATPLTPTGVVKSGVIDAVVGDDSPYAAPEAVQRAQDACIEVALAGALALLAPAVDYD